MAELASYISQTKLHNPFSICTLSVVFVSSRELVQGLLEWLDNGYLLFPGNRRKFIHYRLSMALGSIAVELPSQTANILML